MPHAVQDALAPVPFYSELHSLTENSEAKPARRIRNNDSAKLRRFRRESAVAPKGFQDNRQGFGRLQRNLHACSHDASRTTRVLNPQTERLHRDRLNATLFSR